MNISLLISYEDVFNNKIDFDNLVVKVPLDYLVVKCAYISSELFGNEQEFEVQNNIFLDLLRNKPKIKIQEISSRINKLKYSNKLLFSHNSYLLLIQKAFMFYKGKVIDNHTHVNEKEYDYVIIKLLLHCNSIYTSSMTNLEKSLEHTDYELKLLFTAIIMDMGQHELTKPNSRIYYSQILKCYKFFEFVTRDQKLCDTLSLFLKKSNLENWMEYLRIILQSYIPILNNNASKSKNKKSILKISDNFIFEKEFMDSISISNETIKNIVKDSLDFDFKVFRNFPLYKLNSNEYVLIFQKFFLDKLFNGLTFDYFKRIEESGVFSNYYDFKSYYSYHFSQHTIFNETIETIFKDYNSIFFPERKDADKNNEFGDYIVFAGNKLLLFEFKDISINVDIKYSYDIEKVKGILNDRFIIRSGVKQIISTLDGINNKKYLFINEYIKKNNIKKLNIFPIIIYNDASLNSRGVNFFISNEFNKLTKVKNYDFEINNIILIQLDFLIIWRSFLSKKIVNIINIFNKYLKHVKLNTKNTFDNKKRNLEAFITFEDYFEEYIFKERNLEVNDTSEFYTVFKKLYPDRYEI